MNENVVKVLALFGLVFIFLVGATILGFTIIEVKNTIRDYLLKKEQKRRFNKPPTAKCYCRDCCKWNENNGSCSKFKGWRTADSWFCWDAEPISFITQEKVRKEILKDKKRKISGEIYFSGDE